MWSRSEPKNCSRLGKAPLNPNLGRRSPLLTASTVSYVASTGDTRVVHMAPGGIYSTPPRTFDGRIPIALARPPGNTLCCRLDLLTGRRAWVASNTAAAVAAAAAPTAASRKLLNTVYSSATKSAPVRSSSRQCTPCTRPVCTGPPCTGPRPFRMGPLSCRRLGISRSSRVHRSRRHRCHRPLCRRHHPHIRRRQ